MCAYLLKGEVFCLKNVCNFNYIYTYVQHLSNHTNIHMYVYQIVYLLTNLIPTLTVYVHISGY